MEKLGEWQPIETAPRDGTAILTFPHYRVSHWAEADETMSEDGCFVGRWDDGFEAYWCLAKVTHWMPLPSPPKTEAAE